MNLPGSAAAAVADRPGTSYYVPEVRVARLGDTIQPNGEAGQLLPPSVLGDLVRAEVTRVNTGLSQYSLTFNNWFLETAIDRQQHQDQLGAGSPQEALDGTSNLPFWPRFKYNDFAVLRFGTRLRVDFRYVPEPTSERRSPTEDEQTWTPMISGPITDIRFAFASGQGAQLTVSGEDDLSRLRDKLEKRIQLERKSEVTIVRQLLNKIAYPLSIASPLVDYPHFATDDGQGVHESLAENQSPFDLIQKLAERLDFEVFLEFADLARPSGPVGFHFEPYRGRARYNESLRPIFRLDRDRNLLDYNPTIKIVDQNLLAVVKGRHRDPLLAKEVNGKATHEILGDELQIDQALDGPLLSGPELRRKFFGTRPNTLVLSNQPNMDDVRADWAARAALRKKARELFTIDATTVGVPRIRPGRHVEIRGMRPPFDGFFYATKTVHTVGTDGYRTKITASRPGMEYPPYHNPKGGRP